MDVELEQQPSYIFSGLLGSKKGYFRLASGIKPESRQADEIAMQFASMANEQNRLLLGVDYGELAEVFGDAHRDTSALVLTAGYITRRLLSEIQPQTVPSYMLGTVVPFRDIMTESVDTSAQIVAGPNFVRQIEFVDREGLSYRTHLANSVMTSGEWRNMYSLAQVLAMFDTRKDIDSEPVTPKVRKTHEHYGDAYNFQGLPHHSNMSITIDRQDSKIRVYSGGSAYVDIKMGEENIDFDIFVRSSEGNENNDPYALMLSTSIETDIVFPSIRGLKDPANAQIKRDVIDFVLDDLDYCLSTFVENGKEPTQNGNRRKNRRRKKEKGRPREGTPLFEPHEQINFPVKKLYLTTDLNIAGGASGGVTREQVFAELMNTDGVPVAIKKIGSNALPPDCDRIFVGESDQALYIEFSLRETGGTVREIVPREGHNLFDASQEELDLVVRYILGGDSLKGVHPNSGRAVIAALRKYALFNGESHAAEFGTETAHSRRRRVSDSLTKLGAAGHHRDVVVLSLHDYETGSLILLVANKGDYT